MSALILVIDDRPANVRLLRLLLELEGHRVASAASAAAARLAAERERPDLILMDLDLPDADGLELTRELLARPALADVPIVALSARGDEAGADALSAGCIAAVAKPFDTRTFPGRVLQWLAKRPPAHDDFCKIE